MSPTPKFARSHRRKARTVDNTKNMHGYRVEASWNHRPDAPVVLKTADKRHAYRAARELVGKGAYVIVQTHLGWDRWRTVDEYDGPALAAQQRAAERAAVEAARRAAEEAEQRLAEAEQRDAELARLEHLMVRPPVARDATGRVTVRHTAGGRR